MANIKKIFWITVLGILITGCGTSTSTTKPGITVIFPTPTISDIPYPMVQSTAPNMSLSYPEPGGDAGTPTLVPTMSYHVTQLVVPTPSAGKSVITGQLVVGDKEGGPYIATLYLAKTLPPSNPDFPPLISFSEQTDPLALQDVTTGRFLFSDIVPGQYSIIVWTVFGGTPLADESGHTILFTAEPDETTDLGVIVIP